MKTLLESFSCILKTYADNNRDDKGDIGKGFSEIELGSERFDEPYKTVPDQEQADEENV